MASIAPHLGLAVPEALVVALPESPEGGVGPMAAKLLVPRLERCDAVLIGPGMLDEEAVRDLAAIVLDGADGCWGSGRPHGWPACTSSGQKRPSLVGRVPVPGDPRARRRAGPADRQRPHGSLK